jgi:hypothetical protein
MNKRWLIISLTGLFLLFLIVACTQSNVTPLVETQSDSQGEVLITEKCSDCHSTERVFQAKYDSEGWSNVIDRMVNKGANVNPEEKDLIIDWLVSRDQ